ncbi:MAG: metalloregulator ArsR/SmtB family transcription factor [Pirellulales bacterium]|nr:metalloregulator ArsR/SmtB family transcription factor [Pirellulales bacterium]
MSPTVAEAGNNSSNRKSKSNQQLTPAMLGLTQAKEKNLKELVQVFKLAADETRARVLFYLCNTPELHVRAICELVGQSQPAVSHHLALLRSAGVIQSRRDGKHNYYRIVPRRIRQMLTHFYDKLVESNAIEIDSASLKFSST